MTSLIAFEKFIYTRYCRGSIFPNISRNECMVMNIDEKWWKKLDEYKIAESSNLLLDLLNNIIF